jgi:type IV secretory pathway VirB3-like protein
MQYMKIDFADAVTEWANRTPSVSGLVLIGSRVRAESDLLWRADANSDWDFQLITSKPGMFLERSWAADIVGFSLRAYAARTAVIGGVPKVSAVFEGAEADFVIIPTLSATLLRICLAMGLHRRSAAICRHTQNLAEVIRPGWLFLKGASKWDVLYQKAVAQVSDPRLSDEDVRRLAEGFVCDYIWVVRKIVRGELRAAQRVLYRELLETNLQLFHELKQRRGERTFTKARRIERLADKRELFILTVEAPILPDALRAALEKSASTCRELIKNLLGNSWQWPNIM